MVLVETLHIINSANFKYAILEIFIYYHCKFKLKISVFIFLSNSFGKFDFPSTKQHENLLIYLILNFLIKIQALSIILNCSFSQSLYIISPLADVAASQVAPPPPGPPAPKNNKIILQVSQISFKLIISFKLDNVNWIF